MQAVIVGCSRVGAELAQTLETRGVTVSIIDKDPKAFEQRLHPGFHGKQLVGIGVDRDILEKAGIREAEIFVSATRGDNTNIVSARIAKEHYLTPKVAALIYDPRRAQIYERLGIPTVASVSWSTDQIMARLLPDSELVESTIGNGEVVVMGVAASNELMGKPVSEINDPGVFSIVAITRFGVTQIPDRKTLVQEGDFLHVAAIRSAIDDFDTRLKGDASSQ